MSEPVTVLVWSHRGDAPGFASDLAHSTHHRLLGRVGSLHAVLTAVAGRRPDVVMVDLVALGDIERLAEVAREVPTIVVAAVPAEFALLSCLAGGVRGFLADPVTPDELSHAVGAVAAGGTYVDPRCAALLVRLAVDGRMARIGHGLTLRQVQVLQLAEEGLTNREIAGSLGISAETVKSHLHEAMRRLGVHSRLDAAARAVRPARNGG